MTKKEYQKENEELRKDLDGIIHFLYQTNIDVKITEETGDHPYSSIEDSCMGFFFGTLKTIPRITKKYGFYPYNQKVVRVGDDWSPQCEEE